MKWIKVSEQLPEFHKEVLVTSSTFHDFTKNTTWFFDISSLWNRRNGNIPRLHYVWCTRVNWDDEESDYNRIPFENIKYWMPLPEPPKDIE